MTISGTIYDRYMCLLIELKLKRYLWITKMLLTLEIFMQNILHS